MQDSQRMGDHLQLNLGPYIDALDVKTLTWLHQFVGRDPKLDRALQLGVTNSGIKFGPFVLAICWLWFDARPDQQQRREKLVQALSAGCIGLLIGRVLALSLPFRDRPQFRLDVGLLYPFESSLRMWSAFPSDHAVMAFALATSLVRVSPILGLFGILQAALVISFPRVYFGLHHPSDVIGGGLIGIAVAFAMAWLPPKSTGQRSVINFERTQPAAFYAAGFVVLYLMMTMFDDLRAVANFVFATLRQ